MPRLASHNPGISGSGLTLRSRTSLTQIRGPVLAWVALLDPGWNFAASVRAAPAAGVKVLPAGPVSDFLI